MSTVTYPSFRTHGISDKSASLVSHVSAKTSQLTPLMMVMTRMGREGVRIINSGDFAKQYGEQSLDPNSPYYTHQTEALQTCIENNTSTVAIKRIVPLGAKTAHVRVGFDALEPDQWTMCQEDFQEALMPAFVPLLEVWADNPGEWGNDYAFIISQANYKEIVRLHLTDEAKVYKFRLVKAKGAEYDSNYRATYPTVPNKYGEPETFFVLRPNTISRTGVNYYIEDILSDAYYHEDDDMVGVPIIGKVKFHFETFCEVAKKSPAYNPEEHIWSQDLGKILKHDKFGISPLTSGEPLLMTGGADGFPDAPSYIRNKLSRTRIFDEEVYRFLDSLVEGNPFTDMAKYPYTCVVDTGFTYKTKLALRPLMDIRRDIWCMVSCFTVAEYYTAPDGTTYFDYVPRQTESQILAMGAKLRSAFGLYPESYKYGTSAVRAIIVKNAGVINNHPYKSRRSVGIGILKLLARFMGGSDGNWNAEYAIDSETNRVLRGWSEIDGMSVSPDSKQSGTESGLTYLEQYDTKNVFFPYYRTIYPDQTSVLADFVTMLACCELERLGAEAWRRNGSLPISIDKRREKSTTFILTNARNKFGDRFEFSVSVEDDKSGLSATDIVVSIYANKTKISNTYTIEALRADALVTQNV